MRVMDRRCPVVLGVPPDYNSHVFFVKLPALVQFPNQFSTQKKSHGG